MTGIYKGATAPIVGVSAQNALMFGIQRFTRQYFEPNLKGEFMAGMVTGTLMSVLAAPVEMTKTRLQVQNIGERTVRAQRKYKGPIDVLHKMYLEEGIRGPGRSFWITLVRDSPGYGVYFSSYPWLCQLMFGADQHIHDLNVLQLSLAGSLAGAISWLVIYPIDVIKTRICSEGFVPAGKYRNYAHCFTECYREGGVKTFFRGLFPTLIRALPVNGVTFSTVSVVESYFAKRHSET